MIKKANIVVGLGYGDEGKGLMTDYLCANSIKPLVIRFNGGHQAGHTVWIKDGFRHMFSSFGSGTLRGVPTYWSRFCLFSPAYMIHELKTLPVTPTLYLDADCEVTTHYDVLYNRAIEKSRGHNRLGSCGVGIGATVDRTNSGLSLKVNELADIFTVKDKLLQIRNYYENIFERDTGFSFSLFTHDEQDLAFEKSVNTLYRLAYEGIIQIVEENHFFNNVINKWESLIFEGAQGILLDQNYGHRPYITKSNTTSRNAIQLIDTYLDKLQVKTTVNYVTRAYHTRHGAGPFHQHTSQLKLHNNRFETNGNNKYQGEFFTSYLNMDLMNYAIACDKNYSSDAHQELTITCLDHFENELIPILVNSELTNTHFQNIKEYFEADFSEIFYSTCPCSESLVKEVAIVDKAAKTSQM